MAKCVVFTATENGTKRRTVTVDCPSGYTTPQKRILINRVHESFMRNFHETQPLECSSKGEVELGRKLSAMYLKNKNGVAVENLFQSSKVFEKGGPYLDLLEAKSFRAKKDERLRSSGKLVSFWYDGADYPLEPKTAFYNWIYINTLLQNEELCRQLVGSEYRSFTDVSFNPDRSINCQAEAVAIFKQLVNEDNLDEYLKNGMSFEKISTLC